MLLFSTIAAAIAAILVLRLTLWLCYRPVVAKHESELPQLPSSMADRG